MTNKEKKILNKSFDELWKDLWGPNIIGIQYRGEEKIQEKNWNL